MAKKIKAIKCPHCGSIQVKELRLDYYTCESCSTDFFLDTDDITINHKYHYPNTTSILDNPKLKKYIFIGIGGIILFIMVLNLIPTKSSKQDYNVYSSSVSTAGKEEEKAIYSWDNESDQVMLDQNGNPILIVVGNLKDRENYSDTKDEKIYVGAYDLKTKQKKWLKILNDQVKLNSSSNIYFNTFEDDLLYIIINNKLIYRVNKQLTVDNVMEGYVKNNASLHMGIAKVEFQYKDDGSGFQIVTNDGENIVYMPLINTAYKKEDFYDAVEKKVPNPEILTDFTFSRVDSDFPDEKVVLVKYRYKHQKGYPKDDPTFSWSKDYGRSGIFTERSPYTKRFINPYMKERAEIVDFSILSKDRRFFSASVLAHNKDIVLIGSKPTPSEDDPFQLQVLDAVTGDLKQTISTEMKYTRDNNFIVKDGYVIEERDYYYYSIDGKLISVIDSDDLKMDSKN